MSPLQYLYSKWNIITLLINNLEIDCKSCLHAIYSYFISGKVGVKQVYSAFSGKQLHGSRETLPWHLIPALRNHILGKGNQIDSLFRVFPKMIFSGTQGLARLKKIWYILPGNPKWQKPLWHFFEHMIPRGYNYMPLWGSWQDASDLLEPC